MMYTCPCCGYISFDEFPGSYDICPFCFWEDDASQLYYPSLSGGANKVSLIEAQVNYFQFGASERKLKDSVKKPTEKDLKDTHWFPLFEKRVDLPNTDDELVRVGSFKTIKEISYWLRIL